MNSQIATRAKNEDYQRSPFTDKVGVFLTPPSSPRKNSKKSCKLDKTEQKLCFSVSTAVEVERLFLSVEEVSSPLTFIVQ